MLNSKLTLGVVFLFLLFPLKSVFGEDKVTIDNLEAVLVDLRTKTQSLTEDNKTLTTKNKSLRHQVEDLQDDLNDLQIERQTLDGVVKRLSNAPNEEATQNQVLEKESRDLESQIDGLKKDRVSLEEKVNAKLGAESDYQSKNAGLLQEIADLKKKKEALSIEKSRSFEEEKSGLSHRIEISKGRQEKLKAQLDAAKSQSRPPSERVAVLKEEQKRLDENLRQAKEDLAAIARDNESIRQEAVQLSDHKTGRTAGVTQEINTLRAQIQEFEAFIRNNQGLKIQIASGLPQQTKRLEILSALLKNENHLLAEKRDLLSGRPTSEKTQTPSAAAIVPDLQQKLGQLKDAQTQLSVRVEDRPKREAVLTAKIKNVHKEIEQYQKEFRELKGTKSQTLVELKKKTTQSLKESQANQDKLKKTSAVLEPADRALEKIVKDLKDKQFLLVRDLQEFSKPPVEIKESPQQMAKVESPKDSSVLTQELENLRAQSSELEDLLTQIKKQYNENDRAVREFNNDKQKLTEYFSFLKEENQKLQDELLELSNSGNY